jgi:hypothetical protein
MKYLIIFAIVFSGNFYDCILFAQTGSFDVASAVLVDNAGNIYVTGCSSSQTKGNDFVTIKYDPNGNVVWSARYDGNSGPDQPGLLALASTGNVYVAGWSKGISSGYDWVLVKDPLTGIEIHESSYLPRLILSQNYPNPFSSATTICYSIQQKCHVTLKIYNPSSVELITLVDSEKNPGSYDVNFNGSNLPNGVYYYQVLAGTSVQQKRMTLIK